MQLLYFDRRVVLPSTGIASYRVQGTAGWVCEKKDNGVVLLVPENKVKVGLFAYEVAKGSSPVSIYSKPSISSKTQRPVSFEEGEIVACDVIRQSPYGPENGPFLRLNDGWGWMYEQVSTDPSTRMRQLPVEEGVWTLKVVTSQHGIAMRRHPVDRRDVKTSTVFKPGDTAQCDRRVKSTGATTFYRVAGQDGWVFDVRGTRVMMQLVSTGQAAPDQDIQTNGDGWSISFIRGLALAFDLKEIMLNERSKVISFETDSQERINVYYTTRTVGTALNHPSQGKTQLFRRNCTKEELKEIMQNPRVHTGKGYKKRARVETSHGSSQGPYCYEAGEDYYIDEEEDYRNKLLDYEKEEKLIAAKKMRALKALKSIDDERACDAARMDAKIAARTEEFGRQQLAKEEAANLSRRTCDVCQQVFVDEHAKNQHYEAVHCFECDYCYKEFNSQHALNQHKDARGHW